MRKERRMTWKGEKGGKETDEDVRKEEMGEEKDNELGYKEEEDEGIRMRME